MGRHTLGRIAAAICRLGGAQPDTTPYGQTLQIGGQSFASGIGVLGNSLLQVKNDGYRSFHATVGVDASTPVRDRIVTFAVYGDGKLLAKTPPLKFGDAPREIEADLAGHKVIELLATDNSGADERPVVVTWGAARMLK